MFPISQATVALAHARTLDPNHDLILNLDWPGAAHGRSRKVLSRSRCRSTGRHPSWKVGRMVHWESIGELNAFRYLDATPTVVTYQEQPVTIRYLLEGNRHYHRPDILVEFESARELWDVKTERDIKDPFIVARSCLMEKALPSHGFTYRLIRSEELAKKSRLHLLRGLLRFGKEPVTDLRREQVRQVFAKFTEIDWQSAANGDIGPRGRELLARLALEGALKCDDQNPLSNATKFWWRKG